MFLLRRMDRLILAEIAGPFVGSALLFTGLFFAGGEIARIAEFLGRGVSWLTIGNLILLTLPGIIALTFPMAMLLATLLGFGRLSNDSEMVALLAAGASFERVIVPVAVFGVAVSAAGIWFNDTLVPAATRGRQAIISDVQSRAGTSGRGIGAGFTYPIRQDGILTMLVHVEGGLDPASGELRDLSIETWDRGRVVAIVSAGRARWNGVGTRNWTLSGGVWSAFRGEDGQTLRVTGAGAQTREVALGTPEELASLQRPVAEVSNRTLRERGRLLRTNGDLGGAREAEVEVARRVAIPFASFVFALVGAPLGVRPQRAGKGVGFGQSILITFLYWIALQFFTILGRSGALPPVVAVALPNLVGLLTAAYLIRRVMR